MYKPLVYALLNVYYILYHDPNLQSIWNLPYKHTYFPN